MKQVENGVMVVRLVGTIEENVNFEATFGDVPGELHVSTREVARINSSGVRAWIVYFQKLQKRGVKFRFFECSPAVVEQLNMIRNFSCGGEVTSIYLPYCCPKCKSTFVCLFETAKLAAILDRLPSPKCPKCGERTFFDDIPAEYFEFIERPQAHQSRG